MVLPPSRPEKAIAGPFQWPCKIKGLEEFQAAVPTPARRNIGARRIFGARINFARIEAASISAPLRQV
jgi:hypothetical protein